MVTFYAVPGLENNKYVGWDGISPPSSDDRRWQNLNFFLLFGLTGHSLWGNLQPYTVNIHAAGERLA